MEETKNLAEELQKPCVETFDTTELTIIAAIKKGFNTLSQIQEETTIKENYAKNVLKSLVEKGYVLEIPGSEEDTYMIKYSEDHEKKKLRLPGTLILPVSSFRDAKGQRWVTRGSWHQISEDIDIMNDIEWYEEGNANESQMKNVMKMVSEKKRNTSSKSQSAKMKDAGEAPAEIAEWTTKWGEICEHLKLKVIKGGAVESLVAISPRLVINSGQEFPWGTLVEVILPNAEILEYLQNKNYSKPFTLDYIIQNFKRIRAFKSTTDTSVTFGDFIYKKGVISVTVYERNMIKGKDKVLVPSEEVKDFETVKKMIESDYQLYVDIINKHNENCAD